MNLQILITLYIRSYFYFCNVNETKSMAISINYRNFWKAYMQYSVYIEKVVVVYNSTVMSIVRSIVVAV